MHRFICDILSAVSNISETVHPSESLFPTSFILRDSKITILLHLIFLSSEAAKRYLMSVCFTLIEGAKSEQIDLLDLPDLIPSAAKVILFPEKQERLMLEDVKPAPTVPKQDDPTPAKTLDDMPLDVLIEQQEKLTVTHATITSQLSKEAKEDKSIVDYNQPALINPESSSPTSKKTSVDDEKNKQSEKPNTVTNTTKQTSLKQDDKGITALSSTAQ